MEKNDYTGTGEPDAVAAVSHRLHPDGLDIDKTAIHASSRDNEKASLSLRERGVTSHSDSDETDLEDKQEAFTAEDLAAGNPFPEASLPMEDGQGLTIRALVVGSGLGMVIAASNIYLGLKTGFTFGASLFGSLLGFAIIKAMSNLPLFLGGGFFGPKENVTVQSAATGAAGLTSMFVAAVPAMYRLGLLGATPKEDFSRLFAFCFCSAFYAVFFAIPLRKFYILKQKLIFPSPTATALAIRSLHTAGGALAARKKTKCLGIAFLVATVFCVIQGLVPGILQDQHIFYWFYSWGWTGALQVENWGWYTTLTPAFFGSGMLAGMNASLSFLGGLFLAYAVIGPCLVATGEAQVKYYGEDFPGAFSALSTTQYKPGKNTVESASPRYWLIWPAVLLMLGYSFAELAMNYKMLWKGMKSAGLEFYGKITKKPVQAFDDAIEDPAPKEEQVNMLWVYGGLLASIIMTILVCSLQFNMNAGNVVLAIILAFLFSFIGIQSSGTTDINPLSSVAKATQLIVGGAIKGQGKTGNPAMLENLLAGSISSSAAAHSVDMVGDLKTGHWLRASPRAQFWAQLFGSLFATPLSVGLFVLFSAAYPCINDENAPGVCPFGAPSVAAWKAVAVAVVAPALPVSRSSGITAIIFTIAAMATVYAKYKWIPADKHHWVPNWNAIGIGFLVPNTNYGISMATGAIFCYIWVKKYPKSADLYAYALAAGMVAGEGIAGVINAVLQIAGVPQSLVASTVGVPPWDL
jgi:OPT family oligopeptide transporter